MMRRATMRDADVLYAFRLNDERRNGREHTTRPEHDAWLRARIDSPLVDVFVWDVAGIPAGMIRVDSNGEFAFHVNGRQFSVDVMLAELRNLAWKHGGRLKAVLDNGDTEKIEALKRAGFQVYPATFLAYKP